MSFKEIKNEFEKKFQTKCPITCEACIKNAIEETGYISDEEISYIYEKSKHYKKGSNIPFLTSKRRKVEL